MIDPLEAAIQFLLGRASLTALVATRIANRHRYGVSWQADESSLIVKLDDTLPIYDYSMHEVRLELQARAANLDAAMSVWMALLTLSRTAGRVAVATSQGNALVYTFLPESSLSTPRDVDLDMAMVMGFWRLRVSESGV
jgi:hypothetical protein